MVGVEGVRHQTKFVKLRGISGGCVVLRGDIVMLCASLSGLPELSLVEFERV